MVTRDFSGQKVVNALRKMGFRRDGNGRVAVSEGVIEAV